MLALEVLTEAGDVAVADAFGDAGDREPRGAEEFGGFFEAPFLQVGLESEAVLLAKKAGEIARAGEGDLAGDLGELQRAMKAESEMGDGALERIAFGLGRGSTLLGEAEPDRFDMAAGGVLGRGGISESDRGDEVLVFLGEDTGVGKVIVEALFVKGDETVPDRPPGLREHRNAGETDDGLVKLEVGLEKVLIVAHPHCPGEPI